MNQTYGQLYDAFAHPLLAELESYDEKAIRQLLEQYPLGEKEIYTMQEAFFDRYLQWTGEGFAIGLQTGIRILAEIIWKKQ